MRVFQDKDWEYCVAQWEGLGKRLTWAAHFRMTFYSDRRRNWKGKMRMFVGYWIQWIQFYWSCWRHLFRNPKPIAAVKYFIVLDTNNAYLNCLMPICEALIKQHPENDYLFFVPKEKYKLVAQKFAAAKLPTTRLITEAAIPVERKWLKVFTSKLLAVIDLLKWLSYFPVQGWFYVPAFTKFSFQEHFYGAAIHKIVGATKYLIGASDQWFWDAIFFDAALPSNCTSIIVQHGLIGEFCYPMLTKHYAVWGANDVSVLCDTYGAAKERVCIIGSPYFDAFEKQWKHDATVATHELPLVTFFAQPYFKYNYLGTGKYKAVVEWFMNCATLIGENGKQGLLKFHPLDHPADYPAATGGIKHSKEALMPVLKQTCIAITVDSAVAYECVEAGIPVIQLANDYHRFVDLSAGGFTIKVSSAEELQAQLHALLHSAEAYKGAQEQAREGRKQYIANAGSSVTYFLQKFS